jgi:hypothetical protein
LHGAVEAIHGKNANEPVTISNSEYWINPHVMVCQGTKSKIRDFGRVWDLSGKSAEICQIQWNGGGDKERAAPLGFFKEHNRFRHHSFLAPHKTHLLSGRCFNIDVC